MGSIASRIPNGGPADSLKPAGAQEKKNLPMTNEEIQEQKAYIWACGKNTEGELGLGGAQAVEGETCLPRNVEQLRDFPIKQIASSNTHTVLVTPHGDVHVAGSALHGKLGLQGIEKPHLNKFHMIT
jgi:alpha-tubulin suppressor-like RCC1 family protein